MKSQVWIGKKRLKKPLIQGGMGIGVSLSGLAGAVAKEGGAGTISAAQIGFLQPEFEQNPVLANLKAMEEELQKARKIAPDGILGFNIMVAMNHYETYVRKAVETGADFIVSGAGLPLELPAMVSHHQCNKVHNYLQRYHSIHYLFQVKILFPVFLLHLSF